MSQPLPVIVAAAGQSRRYGRPKLLEPMPGRQEIKLIDHVVSTLASGGAGTILVVMGPADQPPYDMISKTLRSSGGQALHKSPAPVEMRDSIQAGIDRLEVMLAETQTPAPSHVLFTPADIPGITSGYVQALIKVCHSSQAELIRGVTPEGRGVHPVALAWAQRDRVRQIPPDKGLNELWGCPELRRLDWMWDAPNSHLDLDNPRDWDKFRQ